MENFKVPGNIYKPEAIQVDENARYDWMNKFINQMLMSIKDEFVKMKYFNFIKEN